MRIVCLYRDTADGINCVVVIAQNIGRVTKYLQSFTELLLIEGVLTACGRIASACDM